jgi:hypothetical protein
MELPGETMAYSDTSSHPCSHINSCVSLPLGGTQFTYKFPIPHELSCFRGAYELSANTITLGTSPVISAFLPSQLQDYFV